MTLSEVKALLVSADPDIRHYFSMHNSEKLYSYWEETQQIGPVWDDQHDTANQAWRFYVHRYTRTEDDSVAAAIFEALDQDPRTTVRWSTDFDKESGYIHHIFECEGY
jgi:uncharacterized protein YbdZ (MbtH family)